MLTSGQIWKEVKNYLFITVGLAIFVFGWSAFMTPFEVTGGGVAGIATLIYFANHAIPIGLTTFVLNALLIAVAWKILGTRFCVNSIICTAIQSIFFGFAQRIFTQPLVDDMFMSVIIGAAISAAGVGIAINWGGNTGGLDIIALMIGKYRNISYGKVNVTANFFIVGCSFLVLHDVQKLVYSFVVLFVYMFVADIVIDGYRQTYQFMVYSKKNKEIADRVNSELHRGATFLKGYGSYNHTESDVLLIVAHKTDKVRVTRIIKEIDDSAFITITKTASVFGKNFDKLKL